MHTFSAHLKDVSLHFPLCVTLQHVLCSSILYLLSVFCWETYLFLLCSFTWHWNFDTGLEAHWCSLYFYPFLNSFKQWMPFLLRLVFTAMFMGFNLKLSELNSNGIVNPLADSSLNLVYQKPCVLFLCCTLHEEFVASAALQCRSLSENDHRRAC